MDYQQLIERITAALREDDRIRAAWLSGSRGRGTADEYSDVDLWLVAETAEIPELVGSWPARVEQITPVVLCRQLGQLPVFHHITPDWLRFDVVVGSPDEVPTRTRSTLVPLFDRAGLHARLAQAGAARQPDPDRITALGTEFIRVLGLLPVVLGRGEYVVAASGAGLLRTLLIELMTEDVPVEDRGGVLHLGRLLPPDRLAALTALPPISATLESVLAAHRDLAELFLPLGHELAQRTGATWPDRLERAALTHLRGTLTLRLP